MNGLVTFYRDRKIGATYEVHLRMMQGVETVVFVYSAQRIRSTALEDREIKEKDQDGVVSEIRAQVFHAGGGVIAIATVEGERRIKVETVKSPGFEPPTILLALAPGAAPRALDLEEELSLSFGARLLIPGDAATQKRLESFVQYLGYLPLDLEMLVLDAIRRPSLDTRLMEVETRTFGKNERGRIRPLWALKIRAVGRGVVRALQPAVLMLLLAGLAVNGFWTHELLDEKKEPDPPPVEIPTPTTTPMPRTDPPPSPSPPAASKTMTDPASSVTALVKAVRAKSAKNDNMKTLYKVYFENRVKEPLAESDLSLLLSKEPKHLLWGLIKLQALKFKPDVAPNFLSSVEEVTATKKIFLDAGDGAWVKDPDGLALLAAASCGLGFKSMTAPGLPGLSASPEPIVFIPGGKCSDYPFTQSGPGIQKLTRFVETLPDTKP